MPLFLTVEGLDGSGKTTLIDQVEQHFGNNRIRTLGFPRRSTPTGKILDQYLSGTVEMDPRTLHHVFVANLWEGVRDIEEALESGKHVLVDRWNYSTIAYSMARGIPMEWAGTTNGLLVPDVLVFVNRLPEDCMIVENREVSENPATQQAL